nr:CP19k-like protein 2 [Amphibalanus amphitrite]
MVSPQILLAWAAVGIAVLSSPTLGAPVPPPCDLKIKSKVGQAAVTKGGAAVSTTGSSGGTGTVHCVVVAPNQIVKKAAVGNTGVTGAGATAGDGILKNLVKGVTEVKTTKDGTKVKTKTAGKAGTGGTATIFQVADANGGVTEKSIKVDHLLTDDFEVIKIKEKKQGTATSSSGHKGSGVGDSLLKVVNEAETELKLKGLKLD